MDENEKHTTIRLEMFEVYENGRSDPLFVTSDPTEAQGQAQPGDRIVTRWWVREGPSGIAEGEAREVVRQAAAEVER